MTLLLEDLSAAVAGGSVGIRARVPLEPLGGPDDKVFPPTYAVDGRATTRYAMEQRRVGGQLVDSVVLDSVASQANRMELALLDTFRRGELATLPLISVDFAGRGLVGLDRVSSLEASHRVFDAALRDSLDPGTGLLFRLAGAGLAITEATPHDAAALFHYSPTTLLFGGWDSTGPRGGLGAKYERAITSEVVAIGVAAGVKTASRIDQLGIQLKAGPVFETAQGEWTIDPDEARRGKDGKVVEYSRTGGERPGRPSQINHGNVAPSIERTAGGITADRIEAIVVLSFAALRKLRFPTDPGGEVIAPARRGAAQSAAWTALAALGLAAAVLSVEEGFDLRSRCVLAPTGPLEFELLGRGGGSETFTLSREEALTLVHDSAAAAADHGLTWMAEELLLQPSDRLVSLISRSQDLARAGEDQDA